VSGLTETEGRVYSPAAVAAAWVRLLRPRHWIKNGFVLVAPIFGHAVGTTPQLLRIAGAALAFCLLSSAVYVLNDILDREADRVHPVKRRRPIASGAVSPAAAAACMALLFAVSLATCYVLASELLVLALLYVANNLLYFLVLKRKVVADVFSIALGFLLRMLAGAAVVGVEASSWLLICGSSLALFLGFCKRRSEIGRDASPVEVAGARPVLGVYSAEKLNLLCASTATLTIVTYMLFCVSEETITLHKTGKLQFLYTAPFVIYSVLRFLLKTLDLRGEDAAETVFLDPAFLAAGAGWVGAVLWVLYWR
jgi:4-hydroxybenzoate polyprenyltransferase